MRRVPPTRTPPAGEPEVERLINASIVARALPPYAELERIREDSMRRNQRDDIRAALLCQSGWYVHWVEGPGPAVRALMRDVQRDLRHHSHRVLHHSRGARYLPTGWSMMLNASTEPAAVFARRVEALVEARRGGVQYPPTSVLRRLSAPLRLQAAQAASDPESFHRIGVCSADEGLSFDFLRWLGARMQAATHPRRVAGEQDLDSATDYIEFVVDGAPCRVIAVSRSSLQHGLRRAFLPDWPHLLLLLSSDARRNTVLFERVAEACRGLPLTPVLLGVAAEIPAHARLLVAARAAGLVYHQLGLMQPREFPEVWQAVRERLRQTGAPPESQWDLTHPSWVPSDVFPA